MQHLEAAYFVLAAQTAEQGAQLHSVHRKVAEKWAPLARDRRITEQECSSLKNKIALLEAAVVAQTQATDVGNVEIGKGSSKRRQVAKEPPTAPEPRQVRAPAGEGRATNRNAKERRKARISLAEEVADLV